MGKGLGPDTLAHCSVIIHSGCLYFWHTHKKVVVYLNSYLLSSCCLSTSNSQHDLFSRHNTTNPLFCNISLQTLAVACIFAYFHMKKKHFCFDLTLQLLSWQVCWSTIFKSLALIYKKNVGLLSADIALQITPKITLGRWGAPAKKVDLMQTWLHSEGFFLTIICCKDTKKLQ